MEQVHCGICELGLLEGRVYYTVWYKTKILAAKFGDLCAQVTRIGSQH